LENKRNVRNNEKGIIGHKISGFHQNTANTALPTPDKTDPEPDEGEEDAGSV
jgi:hypothetical protein